LYEIDTTTSVIPAEASIEMFKSRRHHRSRWLTFT